MSPFGSSCLITSVLILNGILATTYTDKHTYTNTTQYRVRKRKIFPQFIKTHLLKQGLTFAYLGFSLKDPILSNIESMWDRM